MMIQICNHLVVLREGIAYNPALSRVCLLMNTCHGGKFISFNLNLFLIPTTPIGLSDIIPVLTGKSRATAG